MRVRSSRPASLVASLVLALVLGAGLAACGPATPTSTPTSQPTHESPGPSGSPTPKPPQLIEGGTAEQNLRYFDQVNADLIAGGGTLNGAAFVEGLVAAGFAREDIEVTPDDTTVGGVAADSIMFSVRLGDTCLVGQYGNVGYASIAADVLATNTCLVGTPRPAA